MNTKSINPIRLTINTPQQWEKEENIVAYFQATIAGGYAQKVNIVNEEGVFKSIMGQTDGVPQSDFGKQFLNNKQKINADQFRNKYNFKVSIEYKEHSVWEPSDMKCESMNIEDDAAVGMVISNDSGRDQDYNDCVVIISLYKDSSD